MKGFTLVKHILTLAGVATLVVGILSFQQLEWKAAGFAHALRTGIFWIFVSLVLLTYRISLIDRAKPDGIQLVVFLTVALLLACMQFQPDWVFVLWDFALVFYTLLLSFTCLRIVKNKGWISKVTRMCIWGSFTLVLVGAVFRLSSPTFFGITQLMVGLASLLLLVHFFLPVKTTR